MYYILTYQTTPDYLEQRKQYRAGHLDLINRVKDQGILLLAGALAEPADKALLIFKTDDKSLIEEFVNEDPYVQNGLISHWEIRPWTVVAGTAM